MKNLFSLLFLMIVALVGCSSELTKEDKALMASEQVGSQQQLACTSKPVSTGWEGCKPGTTCASPKSIFGIQPGDLHAADGGTDRELWVYFHDAWRNAIGIGASTTGVKFIGSINNHGLALHKIFLTNMTFWDGPGAKIKAECINPSTGTDECFYDEISVHGAWFETPVTCSFGPWTSGLIRLVGTGASTGEGDISFRGYNTVSGTDVYTYCDARLVNACSP